MVSPSICVALPAYDELDNLRTLLPDIAAALEGQGVATIHVILRSNSTADEQAEVARLGARPILRGPTDSFGDAIRTAIASIEPNVDYVIIMDADGSHDPATIPRLIAHADGNDVVIASRYTKGGKSANGPVLRAMSRSLNLGFRIVLGIHARDVSTNYKLYRREQLQSIDLTCDKFDIVEEILFRLQRLVGPEEFRVLEIPDYFRERHLGVSKRRLGPFVVSYVATLIRLRMSKPKSAAPSPSETSR